MSEPPTDEMGDRASSRRSRSCRGRVQAVGLLSLVGLFGACATPGPVAEAPPPPVVSVRTYPPAPPPPKTKEQVLKIHGPRKRPPPLVVYILPRERPEAEETAAIKAAIEEGKSMITPRDGRPLADEETADQEWKMQPENIERILMTVGSGAIRRYGPKATMSVFIVIPKSRGPGALL